MKAIFNDKFKKVQGEMEKDKNEANASIIRNTYYILSVCQLHAKRFPGVSSPNC